MKNAKQSKAVTRRKLQENKLAGASEETGVEVKRNRKDNTYTSSNFSYDSGFMISRMEMICNTQTRN